MVRFSTYLIFFFFLFHISAFSQIYPDARVDSLMKKGIFEIINQQYDSAKAVFTELKNKYKDIPFGSIYLAATEIAANYGRAEEFNSGYIEKNLDGAEDLAEKLIDKNDKDPWNFYFSALAEGYYAYFYALKKNWLPALNHGLKSISSFEKCLNIDPRFYDGYTAIGTFKYWKSRKTEFLSWIPFVKNEEQKGINLLLISTNHFAYNEYMAFYSLIWIYIDQKKYEKAIKLADKALNKYPQSRFFQWSLARAYEGVDLNKSVEFYSRLLASYDKVPNSNHYNEIVLKHILAQKYYKLGENKKALLLCNEILNQTGLSEYVKNRLKRRFERIRHLKMELSK